MTSAPIQAPRKILLATDLSCRCDRALDRAVALARQWDAELVAAHVVAPTPDMLHWDNRQQPAWHRWADPAEAARQRLRQDLGDAGADIRMIVEEGDPVSRIPEIAEREGCDLIVTGVARDETLGRMLLGATVDRLVRVAQAPVLVVKQRAHTDYRDILVATDFSDAASQGLAVAGAFFPQAGFTLFHGYDMPLTLADDAGGFMAELRRMERETGAAFVARTPLDAGVRDRLRVLVEHGDPTRLTAAYVQDQAIDLTVIASHGRSKLFDIAIGSIAKGLLHSVASDVLVVREAKAAT